jgi:hypothetical protein
MGRRLQQWFAAAPGQYKLIIIAKLGNVTKTSQVAVNVQ